MKPNPVRVAERFLRTAMENADYEEHMQELARLLGMKTREFAVGHKPGGGAISYKSFNVEMGAAGLRRALGNKPDKTKTRAFVHDVAKRVAKEFDIPVSEILEDIDDAANRLAYRAQHDIKLIDAAMLEITALEQDRQRGEVNALRLLVKHFA